MKVLISCYTDIGSSNSPKSLEIERLGVHIKSQEGGVTALCRGLSKDRKVLLDKISIVAPIPFNSLIPKAFTFLSSKFKWFKGRFYSQNMFDTYGATYISPSYDALICGMPSLIKQIRKARKVGIPAYVIASSAPVSFVKKYVGEEYAKHGLKYTGDDIYEQKNMDSYKEADKIFVRSEFTKKVLIEEGIPENKIFPKPVGVFVSDRFKPGKKKDDKFRVIYVGQVCFGKGVHYLLEAWKNLNILDGELVICGGIEEDFKKTFPQYFNQKNIKFLGHTDPLPHYQNSDVMCFPSLSEGSPQAITEAMSCGLPVIFSENSGSMARDTIEGFMVPNKNHIVISEKIKFLYLNPLIRKSMGGCCIERAKEFSIEKHSCKLYNYIQEVLDEEN